MKTETRIRHWTPAHARTMAAHFAGAGTPNGPSFAAELLRIADAVDASPMEDAYGYARYAAMRVRIGKLAEAYAEAEAAAERAMLDAYEAVEGAKRKLDAEEAAYLRARCD